MKRSGDDAATKYLRDIAERPSATVVDWEMLATWCLVGRDPVGGEFAARRAMELDPSSRAWKYLEKALHDQWRFDELEVVANHDASAYPGSELPHVMLAKVAWSRGDRQMMLREADLAHALLGRKPRVFSVYEVRARFCAFPDRREQAIKLLVSVANVPRQPSFSRSALLLLAILAEELGRSAYYLRRFKETGSNVSDAEVSAQLAEFRESFFESG